MTGLTIDPKTYIYPPRAKDAIPFKEASILAEFGYIAQPKFNDSRCLIKYAPGWTDDPQNIQLWNRHGERFRDYIAPLDLLIELGTVAESLGLSPNAYHLLDGGLLDKKHAHIKDTIVIWDILVQDSQPLLGTKYSNRYARLLATTNQDRNFLAGNQTLHVGHNITQNVFTPTSLKPERWTQTWDDIVALNANFPPNSPLIEGLLFKDPEGKLEMGLREKNNSSWQAKSRVQTGRHRF